MKLTRIFLATLTVLALSLLVLAQSRRPLSRAERNRFVVSVTQAGTVNVVEGDVTFKRGRADWDMLIAGDDIQSADRVRTGIDGRLELLLNPGAYLRLAENSEIVFSDAPLDDLTIKLTAGSAIVEATIVDEWIGLVATIDTPRGKFHIARGGLYRFNVDQTGRTEVLVHKGRLVVGDTMVREGSKAVLEGATPLIAAFNRKSEDDFDLWSKDRAKVLIAANKRLSQRAIAMSLRSSPWFNTFNSWFYNPFAGCYTYLPRYSCRSPYGGGYPTCGSSYYPWGGGTRTGGTTAGNTGWTSAGSEVISRRALGLARARRHHREVPSTLLPAVGAQQAAAPSTAPIGFQQAHGANRSL